MRFNSLLAWTSYTALASAQELAAFLDSRDDLSSFRDALDRVPVLRDTLYSTQNITILAPTDAAFEPAAMSETRDILERLAAGGERLSELLQYHVLRGTWSNDTLYQWRAPVHTLFDNGLVTGGQIVLPAPTLDQVGLLSGSPALGVQRYSRLLETNVTNTVEGVTIHTIDNFLHVPLNVSDFYSQWGGGSDRDLNSTAGLTRWQLIPDLASTGLLAEVESTPDITLFTGHLNLTGSDRIPAEELDDVLRYHIATGRVLPYREMIEVEGNYNLTTLEGSDLYVNRRPHSWMAGFDAVWVNDNEVGGGDFIIANGVMNVLDQRTVTILSPPGVTIDSLDSAGTANYIPSSALVAFVALLAFALT